MVNDPYEVLNNPEKYQKQQNESQNGYSQERATGYGSQYGNYRTSGGYGTSGGYENFGGFEEFFGFGNSYREPPKPNVEVYDSNEIRLAISYIQNNNYERAGSILNNIESTRRNARWYYLSSLANYGQGLEIAAIEQIPRATRMEPGNVTYENTLAYMKRSGSSYNNARQAYTGYANEMQKMCLGCLALQCFCTCCRC